MTESRDRQMGLNRSAGTWTAVVPIKPAAARKTRLAGHLPPTERVRLTEAMLAHVLGVLNRVPAIGTIATLAAAPDLAGTAWLRDQGRGLNAELDAIAATVPVRLLVIHADLPALVPVDIDDLLNAAIAAGSAIAPDRHDRGTNALAFTAVKPSAFTFGAGSLAAHRARHPDAALVRRAGLALDIDAAADLVEAAQRGLFP